MRTEGDSWDIVSSVGATALGVAVLRAGETRRADALFHDPYAGLLVMAVGSPVWTRLSAGAGDLEVSAMRSYGSLGDLLVARTCYFDSYFEAAAGAGIRQIVILAAGLDARAHRLDWPAGTTVFELDLPKVLQFKSSAFAEQGVTAAVERREVPVDLRGDWPAALRDNGFDQHKPTAWLAEGLLRYLPVDAQDRLFEHIVTLSAPGSRVAVNMTTAERAPGLRRTDAARQQVLAALDIEVDVDRLWYPTEGRSDPVQWFTAHGWTATRADPARVLIDRGRDVPDDVAADMRTHLLMTATRPGGDSTP
ncbi:SAM-dependent methyltransferase [Nocardia sp. NPDC051052]|uniref:SAM-dependent methyltransferase n=1 Tax=Nocardia sp. NPDC051052 TaxID=3364322 RepID=UPI003792C836